MLGAHPLVIWYVYQYHLVLFEKAENPHEILIGWYKLKISKLPYKSRNFVDPKQKCKIYRYCLIPEYFRPFCVYEDNNVIIYEITVSFFMEHCTNIIIFIRLYNLTGLCLFFQSYFRICRQLSTLKGANKITNVDFLLVYSSLAALPLAYRGSAFKGVKRG